MAARRVFTLLACSALRRLGQVGDRPGGCGSVWAYAALWRLHSGGGALLPGGVEASERSEQLRAECLQRAGLLEREASTRALEELLLDGCALDVDQEAL